MEYQCSPSIDVLYYPCSKELVTQVDIAPPEVHTSNLKLMEKILKSPKVALGRRGCAELCFSDACVLTVFVFAP